MKALFVIGINQYGVMGNFLKGMQSDMHLLGINVDELDISNEDTLQYTSKEVSPLSEYDFIVSFNAVGLELRINGMSIIDYSKQQPVFIFLVDHPVHLLTRFIGFKFTVLCVDQEHVGFCQLCGVDALYFPHAVSVADSINRLSVPIENRNNEILFPASFFDIDNAKLKLKPVWHQISGILDTSTSVTRFMQQLGVLPIGDRSASVELDDNIRLVSILADFYIRARLRADFLTTCAQNNITLSVIGNGSDKYAESHPEHNYEGPMSFNKLIERMANARYVAHNSPGFERGLHERVVMPLSMGTLVLSDVPFIVKSFNQGVQPIQPFSELNESDYAQCSHNAQQQVLTEHTWKARWEQLLNK